MPKETNVPNNARPVEKYSTAKEDFVANIDNVNMDKIFGNGIKEQAVIAKDKNGMYVTAKSFIGSNLLDPYKMYNRKVVTEKDGKYSY